MNIIDFIKHRGLTMLAWTALFVALGGYVTLSTQIERERVLADERAVKAVEIIIENQEENNKALVELLEKLDKNTHRLNVNTKVLICVAVAHEIHVTKSEADCRKEVVQRERDDRGRPTPQPTASRAPVREEPEQDSPQGLIPDNIPLIGGLL